MTRAVGGNGHYRSVFYDGARLRLEEVISWMPEKPSATLPGMVEKIIESRLPNEADKAQITVEGGDHLYRDTSENVGRVSVWRGKDYVGASLLAPFLPYPFG